MNSLWCYAQTTDIYGKDFMAHEINYQQTDFKMILHFMVILLGKLLSQTALTCQLW